MAFDFVSCNLFTYGTLESLELFTRLTGNRYPIVPASLTQYSCYYLKSKHYPGIVAQPGGVVQGTLYLDVSQRDMSAIDAYEDDCYQLTVVTVELERQQTCEAVTYVIPESQRHLLSPRPWNRVLF